MKTIHVNKSLVAALAVTALLTPMLVLGAIMQAGEEVIISKGNDVADNLYVAGGNISINSSVSGDLYTAGGNVLLTETVTEDVVVAGGSITILGDVGDDVRVAGGQVLIAGNVGGELVVAGGSVTVSSNVVVNGDAVIAGGQILLDGEVQGDVEIYGGVASVNGYVQGDMIAKLEDKLTIGDGAVIDGNLVYSAKSADALHMGEGAVVIGEIVFKEIETVAKAEVEDVLVAFAGIFILFKLVSYIVVALILTWLFKDFSNTVVRGVVQDPLRRLGNGFVVVVVTPVAAILLFASLLGIPLGLIVLLAYILLLLTAGIYAGVVVGAWLSQIIFKSETATVTWKNVIGGTTLLTLVTLVPVVGWIIGFGVFLVTVGSLAKILHSRL